MMKKIYLLFVLALTLIGTATAQITSLPVTLTTEDGLPGEEDLYSEGWWNTLNQYRFSSPDIQLSKAIEALRITVEATTTGDSGGGYPCFAISEFYLYDANGNEIELTVDNFETNAQEGSEGPMEYICDRNRGTYFHSLWSWSDYSTGYHYVEVTFPEPLSKFSFEYTTRYQNISPTVIELSDPNAEEIIPPTDSIYASIEELHEGSDWLLTVGLNDYDEEDSFTALQMDIVLPEGIRASGKASISKEWASYTHTSTGGDIGNNIERVILYSTNNQPFNASEGDIFTLSLAAAGIVEGDYEVTIQNIRLTTTRGTEIELSDVTTMMHVSELSYTLTITIKDPTQGYVTGAGTYPAGTSVTIEAIPYEGFLFGMWSDGRINNPRTIVLNKDTSIMAIFKKDNSSVEPLIVEEELLPDVIYDMLGRTIQTKGLRLSDLPKGIYIIKGKKVIK
ncbi:MAG: T9SS type A sorting domain-containing protein [Bacteroidaceae bacterium]|nr:T9SS type A sorting domain-containing protein [Bacteroidaceae bacterium]